MCESSRVRKGWLGPSNTGKGLSGTPLPAVSMTRARAAHNHFRCRSSKGQKGSQRGQEAGARGLGNARVRGSNPALPSRVESQQLCSTLPRPHKTSLPGEVNTLPA